MPPGIIGEANDIEIHSLLQNGIIKVSAASVITTAINMHHDAYISLRAITYTGYGRLEQCGELKPALTAVDIDCSLRPQHPVGNFIAGLYHVDGRTLPGETFNHVPCVAVYGIGKGGEVLALPALRRGLLAWISTEIGVVEVEQELEIGCLDAPGHRQNMREVVIGYWRIHPQPFADVCCAMMCYD